jgi:hypothetical protein
MNAQRVLTLKILFGFMLLAVLTFLVVMIALGKVEEATSYTLPNIETGLLMLASAWSTWAFGQLGKKPPDDDDEGKRNDDTPRENAQSTGRRA